ncbi:tRNA preQ1(34) S-adenosylmethionine ribosyltransferase-isomerase QueA [Candidatus Riflebacteria bacterium]
MQINLSDLFFKLDSNLIAQSPSQPRSGCRMMVLNRKSGEILHRKFSNILDYLDENDAFVVNNSRVLPARLFVKDGKGASVELLYIQKLDEMHAYFMVKPGKKVRVGTILFLENGEEFQVQECNSEGHRLIKTSKPVLNILEQWGVMPVPPYIKKKLFCRDDYRTAFEKEGQSIAAPTAGLHFDADHLSAVKKKCFWVELRLDVGLGTFLPIKCENPLKHKMHKEYFHLSEPSANTLNTIKGRNGRIFACGTTSVRVLESVVQRGCFAEKSGDTDIFIYPGFKFQAVDALLTNFHLPHSTLLLLIWAFAGKDFAEAAYAEAISHRYRFFSFGDAMLIL